MSMRMICAIVPRNCGELMTKTACSVGATGGTILMGRGTATNAFLDLLGFGEAQKDFVIILVDSEIKDSVLAAMIDVSREKKSPFGVLFTVELESFVRCGNENKWEETMENSTHKIINVIVNKGFAGDAMAAARKAGANGGTVLNARGTAKEGDSTFFGMEIVPEKEMLMIVCENEKVDSIIKAIKDLPYLQKPGTGITFTMNAGDFTVLGKGKK